METRKQWYELGPFTVFDVETTGMSPTKDRIVELAAIRINPDGSRESFSSLINPGRRIPPSVIAIHHITDTMVACAPLFTEVGYQFHDFAHGSTLVAHNARFDLSFLQESLARSGMPLWKGNTMDTLRLARQIYPKLPSYSLQNLRRLLHLEAENDHLLQAHRAGADVEWTVILLEQMLTALLQQENA